MANTNRVSGRTTSQSGRSTAATGSSGKMQPASKSGRAAPPSSASGRAPASASGRMAPQPASRASSRQQMAPAAPASRSARRGGAGDEEGGRKVKYKKRKGGPELLIAFGVISVLGMMAGGLGYMRSNQKKEVTRELENREKIFLSNMALAQSTFERAHNAGLLWVMGQEAGANPDDKVLDPKLSDKLFGMFRNDDKVYNVVYEWSYKDKKQKQKTNQQFMYPDRNRIEKMEHGKEEGGLRMNYGFAESKTIPIVVAAKQIKPKDGDTANTGGVITVIVKAEMDHVFEKAQSAKPRNAPAEPPPVTVPEPAK